MRRVLALGVGLAILLPLLAVVVMFGAMASLAGGSCQDGAALVASGPASAAEVPSGLMSLYVGAAGKYGLGSDGWSILAAINYVESDFGRDLSTSSAGAVGWMQFEPGTWAMYGVTPAGAPAPNDSSGWNDPADAIYSAANYLQASGAPGDWNDAIYTYNHAGWYVSEVESDAASYRSGANGQATVYVAATSTATTTVGAGATSTPGTTVVVGAGSSATGAVDSDPLPAGQATAASGGQCAAVNGPSTPGAAATISANGLAEIPQGAPTTVQQMIAAGNEIITYPYVYGGGHDPQSMHVPPGPTGGGYDCSSSVDFLLWGAGLGQGLLAGGAPASGGLETVGDPGPGQWVTIYANPDHAFIAVDGLVMDTAGQQRIPAGSGPRWQPYSDVQYELSYGPYTTRHPQGL